jgi:hypothetical protein
VLARAISLKRMYFMTPASALPAQVNCAYARTAAISRRHKVLYGYRQQRCKPCQSMACISVAKSKRF